MANAPIKRIVVGNGVRALIWKNEAKDNGSWLSVTITRSYKKKDGSGFEDTSTFRRDDLLFVAKASELAFAWCLAQQAKAAEEATLDA